MKTENYKDCAKSDMMNDALKHYEEAGRAINHWRSDIYEAIKAYYTESNKIKSQSPRAVEDGEKLAKKNLKRYTIETYEQNGENIMAKCNDGFNAMELLGIMEVSKEDIINQIKGFVKPDIIKRTVIK